MIFPVDFSFVVSLDRSTLFGGGRSCFSALFSADPALAALLPLAIDRPRSRWQPKRPPRRDEAEAISCPTGLPARRGRTPGRAQFNFLENESFFSKMNRS
jgi:hypothetical protein